MASAPPIRNFLVLGNSGFLGRKIEILARETADAAPVFGASLPEMDLSTASGAAAARPLLKPDTAVVLCAAVKKQLGDTLETFQTNMAIVANFCRLLETSPVRHVTYLSSGAVYGEDVENLHIDEETPVRPATYYGIAKFSSERLLLNARRQGRIGSLLILRPPLIYGPAEPGIYYGPSGFARTALDGKVITLWGKGEERREFVYVDDAVAVATRLTWSAHDGLLNVAAGRSYTYQDALAVISKRLGAPARVESRPRSKAKVDHGYDNAALLRALPGFRFTTLDEGIGRVMDACPPARIP